MTDTTTEAVADALEQIAASPRICTPDAVSAITSGYMSIRTLAARVAELEAENERLRDALRVYADGCDAGSSGACGYEDNLCCKTARAALQEKTDD